MPFKIVQKQVRGFFLIQEVFGLILIDAREQFKYLLTYDKNPSNFISIRTLVKVVIYYVKQ